jgi:hypothetical protein
VGFDRVAAQRGELVVDHMRYRQLLARERRPLVAGAKSLLLKTHPRATHIECSLRSGDRPVGDVRFDVDCGDGIEPVGRYFIVIGAMKAGTTTLFSLLSQHPSLCRTWAELPGVGSPKEINYFRRLYRKGNTPLHYDWRFPFDGARHAWTLEVSPAYAKWPGSRWVPARIASLGGAVRLAYILRDPVARIESHIAHNLQLGRETRNLQHYIRTSSYAWQLDKFMQYFDRKDILLLDFDELRRHPGTILAKTHDFLGIEMLPGKSKIHNTRGIDFELDAEQRLQLAEALRPGVRRLIDDYGFKPAENWLGGAT